MSRFAISPILALASMCASGAWGAERAYIVDWSAQVGTSSSDSFEDVAVDNLGNVLATGFSTWRPGTLPQPRDVYLAKLDSSGTLVWTRQFGSSGQDWGRSVATDQLGNVIVVAEVAGAVGDSYYGSSDALVRKYNADGAVQWTYQFGTSAAEQARGVSLDEAGNAYVVGSTLGSLAGPSSGGYDFFVSKIAADGQLQWVKQLGAAGWDEGRGVSVDRFGNVYVCGATQGSLGGPTAGSSDAFVAKYDQSGELKWIRQFGSSAHDSVTGITTDGLGDLYFSGATHGSLGSARVGGTDAFAAKMNSDGDLQWIRQFGTRQEGGSDDIAVDDAGGVFLTGATDGSFAAANIGGNEDAFVTKFDAQGTLLWSVQMGTPSFEFGSGVDVDSLGRLYVVGETLGPLAGTHHGFDDGFVFRFSPREPVPEPSAIVLALTVIALGIVKRVAGVGISKALCRRLGFRLS